MRYSVLAKTVLASVLLSFQIQAKADPIIMDPSIFATGIKIGGIFSDVVVTHDGGSVWSAGRCCVGDQVLRMDFLDPVSFVSMLFGPDDMYTGIFQIFASDGTLLGEKSFRSGDRFTLALEGPGIAFVLATYGDTGQLGVLTSSVPEPKTLALFGLGLAALGFSLRRKKPN